ncbi:MAG: hypothetical protein Q7J27_04290 [Syntrophales bacterium]|nr:hypothetical protein [Syntrophales bacterium]
MVKISNELIQCADCGKYRSENEPLCPDCGSEKRIINAEIHESFNVSDRITESVAISASIIDIASSATATITTIIPEEVMAQPEGQRSMTASELVVENIKSFRRDEGEIEKVTDLLKNILERKSESGIYKKDDQVIVFNNYNFYGCAIGGDVHSVDITFIKEWNQVQNSIDIEELKRDFKALIPELSKKATTDDEFKALSQVSMAFEDLKDANGPSMLKRIRNSGDWVCGVAKDIGVSLIVELIKGSMM